MQIENKNENETLSSDEKILDKIDYTIQTMDSDLKRKSPKENSIELLELKKEKETEEEKKKEEIVIKKPEKKSEPKKNFNPFLDDLQPIEKFQPEFEKSPETNKKHENLSPLSSEKRTVLENKSPVIPKSFDTKYQPPVVEKNLEDKKSGGPLLIFLFTLSLITVGAGVYYYYFHLNPSEPEESTQEELVQEELPTTPEQVFSEKLQASQSLVTEENSSLIDLIKNQKENLPVGNNQYYQIKQASAILNSSELLSLLDIKLPEETLSSLAEAWVMTYNQEGVLKMNLILEITKDSALTKEVLMNNEYRLPQLLKPLFIDENFVLQDEEITFKDSVAVNGVRYYNLVEGFDNKSIDWGIVDNKYLIIATSKETAEILVKDL